MFKYNFFKHIQYIDNKTQNTTNLMKATSLAASIGTEV